MIKNLKNISKWGIIAAFLSMPLVTFAHVGYVVPENEMESHMGSDFGFLMQALAYPSNLALFLVGAFVFVLLILFFYKTTWGEMLTKHAKERLNSYHEFIPWIIRIALAVALIGAGTSNELISPIIHTTSPHIIFIEILVGFMLMIGLFLVPSILAVIWLYIYALLQNLYLFGNMDFLILALAFLVFHGARPGIDDVLGINLLKLIKIPRKYLAPILRFGFGGAMMYLAIAEKIMNPHISEIVVNSYYLTDMVPVSPEMWVLSAGMVEFFVGACIFLGAFTRLFACIAFAVLSLSFFYFKESVYSHITLFGALAVILIEGSGIWSIDRVLNKNESDHSQDVHIKV